MVIDMFSNWHLVLTKRFEQASIQLTLLWSDVLQEETIKKDIRQFSDFAFLRILPKLNQALLN